MVENDNNAATTKQSANDPGLITVSLNTLRSNIALNERLIFDLSGFIPKLGESKRFLQENKEEVKVDSKTEPSVENKLKFLVNKVEENNLFLESIISDLEKII